MLYSNLFPSVLHGAQRARHQRLQHGPALVVQQVHLVDDYQAHQVREGTLATCREGSRNPTLS